MGSGRSRTRPVNAIRLRAYCRSAEAVARPIRESAATPRLGGAELAAKVCSREAAECMGTEGLGATGRIKRRVSPVTKGKYKLRRERHDSALQPAPTIPALPNQVMQAPVSRPHAKNIWQRLLDFLKGRK